MPKLTDAQLALHVGDEFSETMHAHPWGWRYVVHAVAPRTISLVDLDGVLYSFDRQRFVTAMKAGAWQRAPRGGLGIG